MTEKMEKMVEIIKNYDEKLRNNNSLFKSYFTPDIPDKILKKLGKYYDNHLPVNRLIAYYDTTLFYTCKSGIIFTSEGIYYKYIGKSVYCSYKDVLDMHSEKGTLTMSLNSTELSEYKIIDVLDMNTLKTILEELKNIDAEYGHSLNKTTGKVKKLDIPPEILKKCQKIIHGHSVACGGVGTGLAQIPASDNAVIVPIQIAMIVELGATFGLHITESVAKSIIASAAASVTGRAISQFLVGWIPGIGNAINTATAAGVTEAIGWIAVKNFYERWLEDRNKGRFEGMKDGYTEASVEYENKLRKQADEFLKQKKDVEKEMEEYEKLLNEYEEYIKELEKQSGSPDLISEMHEIYNELQELKRV